jgi:hypothetical protein
MADRYYGLDRGETTPTVDTSTTGKDVELVVDQAVNLTRGEIYNALTLIQKAVQEDKNLVDV